jgi:hypothetical protein
MTKFVGVTVFLASIASARGDAPKAIDCTTSKTASITGSGGNYAVTGACDKVAVTGSQNHVTIEASKGVSLTGSMNAVEIGKADKIAVTGSANHVTWRSGLTVKAPKVARTGTGNTVDKAKS